MPNDIKAPPSAGSKAAADVASLLRARNPLLWIVTREEARTERLLMDAAEVAQYEARFWDCATGITNYAGQNIDAGMLDPAAVIAAVRDTRERTVWILRDMHKWLADPTVLRGMRSLARALTLAPRAEARSVIVLTPSSDIPPELAGHAIAIDWPLPDRSEIAQILDAAINALPDEIRAKAAPNGTRDAAIDAAVGLTAEEAQACYARSLVTSRRIDPLAVSQEKRRVIAREKVLDWADPVEGGLSAVGGLAGVKSWLATKAAGFTKKARDYGLPAPKGVLCVGVPGCGKSLLAKACSATWGFPLLRLDMGALKSKFVGESEANIRKALKVAETVAPCILWLDEIEKALAGATQGAADGGVSGDALGTILQWMQDRQGSVFMIATANDVSALPPELMRKGRFDEVFFVDLPNQEERAEIAAAALRANKRELPIAHCYKIAGATDGFTGAEIAALIPEAMYAAFTDDERAITVADVLDAAKQTVPLSKTAAEKITKLREWAKGRARPASIALAQSNEQRTARALDID